MLPTYGETSQLASGVIGRAAYADKRPLSQTIGNENLTLSKSGARMTFSAMSTLNTMLKCWMKLSIVSSRSSASVCTKPSIHHNKKLWRLT